MSEFETGAHRPVDRMVAELMATGLLPESDKTDLEGYLSDWQENNLDPEDLRYLVAFHRRLVLDGVAEPDGISTAEVIDWRARAELAEAEVLRLRTLLAQHNIVDPTAATDPALAYVEQ